MDTSRAALSSSEVASEAGSLVVGLGIITMALSPFAVPGLLLALLLVLPLAPLALVAGALWLLARILLLPLRFIRSLVSGASRRLLAQADGLEGVGGSAVVVDPHRHTVADRPHDPVDSLDLDAAP